MEATLPPMFMLKPPKSFLLMVKDVQGVGELYFMQRKFLKVEDATTGKIYLKCIFCFEAFRILMTPVTPPRVQK